MTERVSLVEAYDNKDVVSQIYRIREIAQGAEDKSAEAVQKADAAVAVVPEVEAAVVTANAASQAAQQAAGQVTDCVKKTGSTVPQVISGTGGLQIAGDLSVGGDLTVSADGHVHMDASDIEVANMAIEKSGAKTVMSNDAGVAFASPLEVVDTVTGSSDKHAVNAKRLMAELDGYGPMVRNTGNQHVGGQKYLDGAAVGHVGVHTRLTGTSKIGIADIYYTPSSANIQFKVWLDVHARGFQFDGYVQFSVDPDNNITGLTKGGLHDGSTPSTAIYAWTITEGDRHYVRIAIGNETSNNNHIIVNSIGGVVDAGYDCTMRYDICGSTVTSEVTSETAKVIMTW